MTYVWLAVFFSSIFQQLFRFWQRRGRDDLAVGAVNYVAATVVISVALMVRGSEWSATASVFGVANGVLYYINLVVMLATFRIAGVGVTTAMIGCSGVAPVLWSWWVWDEPMSEWRWTALALTPAAMILMRPGWRTLTGEMTNLTWRADVTLLLAFVFSGAIGVIHKCVEVYAGPATFLGYQVILFSAAAIASVGYAIATCRPCSRADVGMGSAIGVFNVGTTAMLLLALAAIPATIVFPTFLTLGIVVNVLASRLLWQERLARRQYTGLGLAITVVVLVNL